ncbi:Uncharacterised protein [Chlamydia trachomatis]|nr:Uncharacterised protein [Chlamydia trachomatis]
MALATSETSARVGRGLRIIDSSICVAVIQNRPVSLDARAINFCSPGTSTIDNSIPRSPRAIMIPSAALAISWKFCTPK